MNADVHAAACCALPVSVNRQTVHVDCAECKSKLAKMARN